MSPLKKITLIIHNRLGKNPSRLRTQRTEWNRSQLRTPRTEQDVDGMIGKRMNDRGTNKLAEFPRSRTE